VCGFAPLTHIYCRSMLSVFRNGSGDRIETPGVCSQLHAASCLQGAVMAEACYAFCGMQCGVIAIGRCTEANAPGRRSRPAGEVLLLVLFICLERQKTVDVSA